MSFMIQNHDLFVVKEERSTLNHRNMYCKSMYETYVVHNYTILDTSLQRNIYEDHSLGIPPWKLGELDSLMIREL